MLRLKKLPWASIGMMMLTYGVFGWIMSASPLTPWLAWLGMGYIMIVITGLTLLPLRNFQKKLDHWFESKFRSIFTLICGAFLMAIVFSWLEVFLRVLLLIAAALLVRIDLISKGLSKGQVFCVLGIFALGSYSLGVLIHEQLAIVKHVETTFLWY